MRTSRDLVPLSCITLTWDQLNPSLVKEMNTMESYFNGESDSEDDDE